MNKAFKSKATPYLGVKLHVNNTKPLAVGARVCIQGGHYVVERVLSDKTVAMLPLVLIGEFEG